MTGRDARVGRNESGCAELTGLEPAASGVTDRRSNQLSYNSVRPGSQEAMQGQIILAFSAASASLPASGKNAPTGHDPAVEIEECQTEPG